MFIRASTLVLAIAASVIAAPGGTTTPTTINSSQCDTGDIQCCNAPVPTSSISDSVSEILGLLGVSVPLDGLLAFGCTPITVIGTGSGAVCEQQPICCSNDDASGLVNVVCSPLSLNM